MQTKLCSMCKMHKPLFEFPEVNKDGANYRKSGTNTGSHESRCRPCKAEYARQWRKLHKNYQGSGKLTSVPEEDRLLVSAISDRLMQAKQRAIKYKDVEPNIDREYLYALFKGQSGKCALSGVDMKIEKGAITCLSLDKIEPDKGYTKGNVQWLAWAVNRAKGDMPQAVFLSMCEHVLSHQKVQRLS